jgi:dUTP pyrophosphatase
MSAAPETSPPAKRVKTAEENGVSPPTSSLQIKKLSDKGRLPTRGSAFAAGYDVYASKDTTIPARGKALVSTDISMAVPEGTCESPAYLPDLGRIQ